MGEDIYANVLADEFLPGVVYPFDWSVLAGMVDASWNRIRRDLRVEGDDIQFVRTFYHHAYWNMTKITTILTVAGLPQALNDRLFEPPTEREYSTLDDASADRVLAMGRAMAQDLEPKILESERQLEEIRRKQGKCETEEEMVQELDRVLVAVQDVIFRETAAWLLVGLNLSLLDEWTGRQHEARQKKLRYGSTIMRLSESNLEEVWSMANRYRSHWELARSVKALGWSMAEERLFALGDRFVSRNLLEAKEDVRYLTVHEVRQIVSGGCATNTCNNYALRTRVRRTEMDQHAVDGLPTVIRGETVPLPP